MYAGKNKRFAIATWSVALSCSTFYRFDIFNVAHADRTTIRSMGNHAIFITYIIAVHNDLHNILLDIIRRNKNKEVQILIFAIKYKHGLNDPKWCNIKNQDRIHLSTIV